MKIRDSITLIFCLLTGSLLFVIFLFIYYSTNQFTKNEFFQRLKERVNIAALDNMGGDESNDELYRDLRQKHLQVLPDEQEMLLRVDPLAGTVPAGQAASLPEGFLKQVFARKYAQTKLGEVYYAALLYSGPAGDQIVVISARDLYGRAKMKTLLNILLLSFLSGLVLIYITGVFYAGHVLAPISAITDKVNEISATNLHTRLDEGKNQDEMAELAATFNGMLDRLQTAFDIQNNFVNNASHELRNPLTAILGEIEVTLSKDRSTEDYQLALQTIQNEAQRLDRLINSLLKLAQSGLDGRHLPQEDIRMDELILEVKEHMDTVYPDNRIVFDFTSLPDNPDLLVLRGNASLMGVALNNLMDNACKFSAGREVRIKVGVSGSQLQVIIQDQGVGIPEGDLRNIAEPFFRAGNARRFKGFGVGLPLAQKIIHLHGGQLLISSEMERGTTATMQFPIRRTLHHITF